jgi:hypothetical protein
MHRSKHSHINSFFFFNVKTYTLKQEIKPHILIIIYIKIYIDNVFIIYFINLEIILCWNENKYISIKWF